MKMILVAFDRLADNELLARLKEVGVECYTLFRDVKGRGKETEARMTPLMVSGDKHFLAVAIQDEQLDEIREILKKIKADQKWAGIKVFVMPLDECF